jgi:hypothetical protein
MAPGTHSGKNDHSLKAQSGPARSWVLPRLLGKIRKAFPRAARRKPEPHNKT